MSVNLLYRISNAIYTLCANEHIRIATVTHTVSTYKIFSLQASGNYVANIAVPEEGWRAFFIQASEGHVGCLVCTCMHTMLMYTHTHTTGNLPWT